MIKKLCKYIPVYILIFCLALSAAHAENSTSDVPQAEANSTVSTGDCFYAYEDMTVYNNGGIVYSTGATVYNNGGTVYQKGGTVYNNGGSVYAASGRVFNNSGTVYRHDAEVLAFEENAESCRLLGYYELKLGGYYEPYVELDGVTVEPGSEKMIISEDSMCRITPFDGVRIMKASSDSGKITYDRKDGSVLLTDVDGDTTLTLSIQTDK